MIGTPAFTAALKFAAHASAKTDVRYYLIGVLFEFSRDGLILVGCDGHRMAVAKLPGTLPFDGSFVVDTDSVKQLLSVFGKDKVGEISFALSGTGIVITSSWGNVSYTPKLQEGKYPDWRRAVPADGRVPGRMPAVDISYLSAACTALVPLTGKTGASTHPVIADSAGATEPVKLRPHEIKVAGIESAYVVIHGIRE